MTEITAFFAEGIAKADQMAQKADSALRQGLAAVAYQRAFEAAAQAQLWLLVAEIIQRYAVDGLDAAVSYLGATRAAVGRWMRSSTCWPRSNPARQAITWPSLTPIRASARLRG
ncbi:MAG TPA: hypothetical protein EYP04_04330 [Anaerolineae bacterium]|nr:hypothetical protein [Anaerolineae bacterium]HIQ05357.1 hypothetical protein [Anaerolineae bacterium]